MAYLKTILWTFVCAINTTGVGGMIFCTVPVRGLLHRFAPCDDLFPMCFFEYALFRNSPYQQEKEKKDTGKKSCWEKAGVKCVDSKWEGSLIMPSERKIY